MKVNTLKESEEESHTDRLQSEEFSLNLRETQHQTKRVTRLRNQKYYQSSPSPTIYIWCHIGLLTDKAVWKCLPRWQQRQNYLVCPTEHDCCYLILDQSRDLTERCSYNISNTLWWKFSKYGTSISIGLNDKLLRIWQSKVKVTVNYNFFVYSNSSFVL